MTLKRTELKYKKKRKDLNVKKLSNMHNMNIR
jgi:hypothetical protein